MQRRFLVLPLVILLAALLTACSPVMSPASAPAATEDAPQSDMDDTNMQMDESDQPPDLLFIDSMIVHHQGAIAMAEQALTEATKPDIKTLAEAIIQAQEAEIAQMQQWRDAWYPDVPDTEGMEMEMGTMAVAEGDTLFDLRFIEAMIPHHEGAIAMAKAVQPQAEHEEIENLAAEIIRTQETEITQMQQWQEEWSAE